MNNSNKPEYYEGWEQYYKMSANKNSWDENPDKFVTFFLDRIIGRVKTNNTHLHIADFGCGDGRNLWPWLLKGFKVTAVDISPSALEKISDKCLKNQNICPSLINADLQKLPLGKNQFDFAQCFDALPQVFDVKLALDEIEKSIRPQGEFIFNVFTPLDCAYGEGQEVEDNTFIYKNTLFRFFDENSILNIIPKNFEVLELKHESWKDPPHIPFRPEEHVHDGIYILCQKK